MTRRHFLTTAMRAVLLATLLPFLPPVVRKVKAEVQPDRSVLFDGTDYNYLKEKPFVWPHGKLMTAYCDGTTWFLTSEGRLVCLDQSGNGNHLYADQEQLETTR